MRRIVSVHRQVLWEPDYSTATWNIATGPPDPVNGGRIPGRRWRTAQRPDVGGMVQTSRIRTVTGTDVPGDPQDPYRPTDGAMRVELRPGDETNTGGYVANRAEVYDRWGGPYGHSPATDWPDPEGSERWYQWPMFLPAGFAFGAHWLTFTQWKNEGTGSPQRSLELAGSKLKLGGQGPDHDLLSTVPRGVWFELLFGFHWSPDPTVGWSEAHINGTEVLARTSEATMRTWDGETMGQYLKQGIYRSKSWTDTHVAYYGPIRVAETQAALT